jgi:hypothetical protein
MQAPQMWLQMPCGLLRWIRQLFSSPILIVEMDACYADDLWGNLSDAINAQNKGDLIGEQQKETLGTIPPSVAQALGAAGISTANSVTQAAQTGPPGISQQVFEDASLGLCPPLCQITLQAVFLLDSPQLLGRSPSPQMDLFAPCCAIRA